jgi:hypothetical protein
LGDKPRRLNVKKLGWYTFGEAKRGGVWNVNVK